MKSKGGKRVVIASRHQDSVAFIRELCASLNFEVVDVVPHLQKLDDLPKCDIVIGNLPLYTIAQLNRIGIRYGALSLTIPSELRGTELTLAQIRSLDPKIIEFEAFEKGELT